MDLRDAIESIARRIGELLRTVFDSGVPEPPLDLGGLADQLVTHRSGLFLGVFDEAAASAALESRGILPRLRDRIGADLRVRLHPDEDIFRIVLADRAEGPDGIVVEVKARLAHGTADPAGRRNGFPSLDFLVMDWLLLQDPLRPFPDGRRPLPGQRHPGLGFGEDVIGTIVRVARRLGAGGVIGIPMYFHAAVIYHRLFAYIDPVEEGRFQALMRDLAPLPLADAAHAVAQGRVRDLTHDEPYRWEGCEMVLPLAEPVRAYLADRRYADAAARTLLGSRFRIEPAGCDSA